jgi:hypothetical protein
MSVPNRTALLQDAAAADVIRAALTDVRPAENRSGFDPEGLG